MFGWTKKGSLCTDPSCVSTSIGPAVAPFGTVAVIWSSLSTVNVAAVDPNRTSVAVARPEPVITTVAPTGPRAGATEIGPGCADAAGALLRTAAATTAAAPMARPARPRSTGGMLGRVAQKSNGAGCMRRRPGGGWPRGEIHGEDARALPS